MKWIDKTCENCIFRSGQNCVIGPPSVFQGQHWIQTMYPQVFIPAHTERPYKCEPYEVPDTYIQACAQYKEKEKL